MLELLELFFQKNSKIIFILVYLGLKNIKNMFILVYLELFF